MATAMSVSVVTGRWGPCCSVEPSGISRSTDRPRGELGRLGPGDSSASGQDPGAWVTGPVTALCPAWSEPSGAEPVRSGCSSHGRSGGRAGADAPVPGGSDPHGHRHRAGPASSGRATAWAVGPPARPARARSPWPEDALGVRPVEREPGEELGRHAPAPAGVVVAARAARAGALGPTELGEQVGVTPDLGEPARAAGRCRPGTRRGWRTGRRRRRPPGRPGRPPGRHRTG